MPCGRFVSTYNRDFKPFSEHHLHVTRVRLGPGAHPFITPIQNGHDFWSTFYKTTNSDYGSPACSQPLSFALSPTPLPEPGFHATPVQVLGAVCSTLKDGGAQDTVVKEAQPAEEKSQLHYVIGEKALVPQETQNGLQKKVELLYEEGVIESSHFCPACFTTDHVGSASREAGLHHLLHLPVVSSPIASIKGVENVDNNAFLTGLTACGLRGSAYLQPFPRQCCCSAWETELPYSCCFKMQTFPPCIYHGSSQPGAPAQLSREPVLTEYQASYTPQWPQPKIFSSVHLSRHHIHHQSL